MMAWLASAREDIGLLAGRYLPEFLVISILLVVSWTLRTRSSRHVRPPR